METTIPFVFSLLLSVHGLRKKSLSPSGALTAFVVGLLMMAGGTRVFGVALIGFYLIGSRATKCEFSLLLELVSSRLLKGTFSKHTVGKDRKARLEDGYHEGGYRSGWQVLSNSFTAFLAAFVWNAAFVPWTIHAFLGKMIRIDVARRVFRLSEDVIYDGTWCPLSTGVANDWSRILIFTALG